ncbi:MAG TPA: P-II family nitrogen regulator [Vicinamibacteria bacterium]|nr:P-II family nitrogen regulator [Vicinamibacteria bacterium]
MKLIVAMIRPDKLEAVQEALDEPGVGLLAVSQAVDPREPCPRSFYRGLQVRLPRVRLRIEVVVVNEALVEWAKGAIARAGSSNDQDRLGAGDILVMPLDEHVRISRPAWDEAAPDDMEHGGALPPLELGRLRP